MRNLYQKTTRLTLVLVILLITQTAQNVSAQVMNEGFISPTVYRQGLTKLIRNAPGGKLYVYGDFDFHGEQKITKLVRLLPDGLLDASFNAVLPAGSDKIIDDLEVLSNGNIVFTYTKEEFGVKTVIILGPNGQLLREIDSDFATALEPDNGGGFFLGDSRGEATRFSSSFESVIRVALVNGQVRDVQLQGAQIMVAGEFSMAYNVATGSYHSRSLLARFDLYGNLDRSFNGNAALSGFGSVQGVLVQPDGKVLPLDKNTPFSGQARPIRLNVNGSLDTGFAYPFPSSLVIEDASYDNGKLTVVTNRKIARLNNDGSLDASFRVINYAAANVIAVVLPDQSVVAGNYVPATYGFAKFSSTGIRIDAYYARLMRYGQIYSMDRTATPIFVGGDFMKVGSHLTRNVARLNRNGTILTKFKSSVLTPVLTVEALTGEKVIANTSTQVYRVKSDGTLDPNFSYSPIPELSYIKKIIVQPDGKILVGGRFHLFRINANGSRDYSFSAELVPYSGAADMNFELDNTTGKIVYTNWQYDAASNTSTDLRRLNPNGTRDASFTPPTFAEYSFFAYFKALIVDNHETLVVKSAYLFEDHRYDVIKLNADGSLNADFQTNAEAAGYSFSRDAFRFGNRIILSREVPDTDDHYFEAIFMNGTPDHDTSIPVPIEFNSFYSDNDTELFVLGTFQGVSRPFQIVKLTYPPSSAVASSESDASINFFPNPVKNQLTVNVFGRSTVNIFDGNGSLNTSIIVDQTNNTVDLSALKPGRYVIEVICDGKAQREHMIKE